MLAFLNAQLLRDSEWTCRIYEGLAGIAHARWADSETVLVTVDFQRLHCTERLGGGQVGVKESCWFDLFMSRFVLLTGGTSRVIVVCFVFSGLPCLGGRL